MAAKLEDRVFELYLNKTILISGGTGFMGKVLLEKLLRCTNLKRIYIIIRTKKGKTGYERLNDIFNGPLYDQLRMEKSVKIFEKVLPIVGDVSLKNLGLSLNDRLRIIDEVDIIFHCAATVRFDTPLKQAVLINVRGTREMLALAKDCNRLMIYQHLSTAYCHLKERVLREEAYSPPADPNQIIKIAEWMDEETINLITDRLLGGIPNTYAFTKALSESLTVNEMSNLPIIIVRPSIVIPIWREPLPGWTDNINGPTGLLIGAGKGVIRTMYCNGNSYGDLLPVDIAINGMLLTTLDYHLHNGIRRIYNLTSSSEYKLTWDEIIDIGRNIVEYRMPLNWVVWYPGGSMKRSRFLHNIAFFFTHFIPAILLDGLLMLMGYKPILMRVQNRIKKGFEVFEYYANHQWEFNNEGSLSARSILNDLEREKYKVDGEGIDYHEYFYDCTHAARLYILNESDDTLPTARRHMRIMWWVDKICKYLFIIGIIYYLLKVFGFIL